MYCVALQLHPVLTQTPHTRSTQYTRPSRQTPSRPDHMQIRRPNARSSIPGGSVQVPSNEGALASVDSHLATRPKRWRWRRWRRGWWRRRRRRRDRHRWRWRGPRPAWRMHCGNGRRRWRGSVLRCGPRWRNHNLQAWRVSRRTAVETGAKVAPATDRGVSRGAGGLEDEATVCARAIGPRPHRPGHVETVPPKCARGDTDSTAEDCG